MPVKAPLTTRERRSLEISGELGRAIVAVSHVPFEAAELQLKALEKRLLASHPSAFWRREIRRRIAEELLTQAFGYNRPWPDFGRALRHIQRLRYSNTGRRYHVAALYALWCKQHPEHNAHHARRLLDEAERSILRLSRDHPRRTELLKELATLRARTGFHGNSHPSR